MVGIAAVFDGHNGAEASDMASRLLLDYFALHINFLLDATFSSMTTTRKLLIGRLPSNADHPVIPLRDELMHLYNLDANMQFSSFFHFLAFINYCSFFVWTNYNDHPSVFFFFLILAGREETHCH